MHVNILFCLYIELLKQFFFSAAETLDVLESWVIELFSNIKKGPQEKPEASLSIPIWESGKLFKLQAVKDIHILDLSWTLPSLRKDYTKKAEDYLAHLLGHGQIIYADH